jgi:hypothetical protein
MYREEGIRGLYRGFTSFSIGMLIYLTFVPMIAHMTSMRSPVFGFKEVDD